MGTVQDNEVLKKVDFNEPIFVIRAQDYTAPKTLINWIAENINSGNTPDEKLREVFELALAMRKWPARKSAD